MGEKKKATLSDVQKAIAPYLTKKFLQKAYIDYEKVGPVYQMMRTDYRDAKTELKQETDDKLYLKIKVKGLLSGGELQYEIKVKGQSVHRKDTLSWIDRIEEFDAFMN